MILFLLLMKSTAELARTAQKIIIPRSDNVGIPTGAERFKVV
jgi:hypothetical protein